MLDGAFTTPKLRRLAVILEVPWPHALGLAGLLWRFTAKHAPTGEVGRHAPEEIAEALEWKGKAAELVEALVRCRLLDRVPAPALLLVHDWPIHAPRYVLATLKRNGLEFSKHYTADPTADPTAVETVDPTAVPSAYTSSSTSASSSASSSSSPAHRVSRESLKTLAEVIWKEWVPGRKVGRKRGLEAIAKSIKQLAADEKATAFEAAEFIKLATRRDATRYKTEVESKGLDLKFVPLGSTYFSQERWNDGNEIIDESAVRREGITNELARIRAGGQDMGRQLDAHSQTVAELGADR